MAFKTQRGLSQHKRLVHPKEGNDKRLKAATDKPSRKPGKGYGKMWLKDEADTMARLEKSCKATHKSQSR
jgi:hypothetical protein